MVLIWSDVVRPTTLGPTVFEVVPGQRWLVRDWLTAQDLPHAAQRDVHSPTVEGWALLDGGITAVSGYGLTSLAHGIRVVGFGALRFLLAELDVEGPAEPFPGEEPVDLDELRRRRRVAAPDSPDALEQAELLATCRDAVLLRWVAATLSQEAGEHSAPAPQPPPPPEPPAPPAQRNAPEQTGESTLRWSAPDPDDLPGTGRMPLVPADLTPPGGSRF
jgi:hypothetical protein